MAVNANIGTAWISVVPSTDKLAPAIKDALKDAEKSAVGSGSSIGQGLTSGINKTLKAGVIGVGVAAGGVLAASITKGLGRLTGIDNAQAKLAGLGHEAQAVEGIMDDALASVKGTAFGLEDAATVSASAVAAGIKPGQDLQRTLKLTGDAATIAGVGMGEMGAIFNKVAASNKMQMDVANQLMDAGIPIMQMVAEEMGVTAEEATKMASAGEISFETFQSAMEKGLGGAALKSGDTVQGAFANMGAAAGRFGAKLAAPIFSAAPAVFGSLGGAFDTLGEKLEPLIEDFADWLAPRMESFATETIPKLVDGVMGAVDAFIEFGGWVKDNAEWIKPLAAGIGGAVAAIYTWNTATNIAKGVQAAFNVVLAANPIMLAVIAVAALAAGLVYFFTKTETGKKAWETFTTALTDGWNWVTEKVGGGIDWLQEKFDKFTGWLSDAWNGITSLFGKGDYTGEMSSAFGIEEDSPIISFFFNVRDAITSVRDGISQFLTDISDFASGIADVLFRGDFTGLGFGIEEDSGFVDFLFKVRDAVTSTVDFIKSAFETIKNVAVTTLGVIGAIVLTPFIITWNALSWAISAGYENIIKPTWDLMVSAVMWLWENGIKPALESISEKWNLLQLLIGKAIFEIRLKIYEFQTAITALWLEYVQPVLDAIRSKWDQLSAAMTAAWNVIKTAVFDAWNWYVGQVRANWDLVTTAINNAWTWLKDHFLSIWNMIKTSVLDAWNAAVNFLRDTFSTVTTNISDKWSWLRDQLSSVWQWIDSNVLGKFREGLDGLKSFFSNVVDGIRDVWNKLRGHLAKPINFLINTVYNDGILRAWETMREILPSLAAGKRIEGIPEHATGGRISGPGTGTSDDVLMWGSNGEHMLTTEEVRRFGGHDNIYRLRAMLRGNIPFTTDGRGQLVPLPRSIDNKAGDLYGAAPDLLPKFATGGEIRPLWEQQLERGHAFAKAQHGKPYQWAGPGGPGQSFDCSGYMGSIAAEIQGANPWQRYWATMSFANGNTAQGFVPGLGPGFSIGLFNGGPYGGHTAGTLGAAGSYGTTNVESGGSPSMVKYGIGAAGADDGSFTHQYHLPIGADGAFVSGGAGGFDFAGAVKKWVADKLSEIIDPIKGLLPSPPPEWQGIPGGVYNKGKDALTGSITDKVEDLGSLVSGVWSKITDLFDSGGVLQSGRMAMNLSGKPEAILTNAQWGMFNRMAGGLPMLGESLEVVAEELRAAFDGGDFGMGELASYVGLENAEKILDEVEWMGVAVGEVRDATRGVDSGVAGVGRLLGGNYKMAAQILNGVESISAMSEEISKAYAGGDWGYGELASVIGNEQVAKAIVDGAAALGMFIREMGPQLQKSGTDYATTQATSALDVVGLGGLVPLGQKLGTQAWEAYQASPVEVGFNGQGITFEIEAESDEDLIRVGQFKRLADQVHGLDVKVNKRPAAASITRGGVM